jgi:probable F420-dependent oxidoreductase
MPFFPELGFYTLPGHVAEPADAFEEIRIADALGLGSVWISERLSTKSGDVLSGAAAALSSRMGVASGLLANLPLRHPLVIAAYAATMMKVTNNRFALGIGRGVDAVADATGTPRLNFRLLEDIIGILRRLWDGETVDYSGPAGTFRGIRLGAALDVRPPIIMAAQGDKTCRWAGRHCDGVLYNSLWSGRAVEHSTREVRAGAAEAGRDPASVRVWAILVTACDVPEASFLRWVIRRMNTYLLFPGQMETFCAVNGWDASRLPAIRDAVRKIDGARPAGLLGDEATTRDLDDLRRIAALYPRQWIEEGHAVGSAEACARIVRERFDAGADGIIFHGTHPRDLRSLTDAWPRFRPDARFADRSANPGR